MSEKAPIQPEQAKKHENTSESHEHHAKQHEAKTSSNLDTENQSGDRLKAIRQEVNKQAHDADELRATDKSKENTTATQAPVKRQLQALMRDRTLTRIRKELPAPERVLSKFIHTKPVEAVSAVGEKTVARPYGLLGGGFSAFIGSLLIYLVARNYGFKYNLFLFFTFFVAGYILATVIEVLVKILKKR